VFCTHYANTKALAGALGVSAGVMLYVSFVEIFAIKSVESFATEYPDHGSKYATLCFFCGVVLTIGLDALVHQIGHYVKRNGGDDRAVCVCDTNPEDLLTGERKLWSDALAAATVGEGEGSKEMEKAEGSSRFESDAREMEMNRDGDADHAAIDVEEAESGGRASNDSSPPGSVSSGGTVRRQPNPSSASRDSVNGDYEIELLTSVVKHGVAHQLDTPSKEHLKNMGAMTALAIGLHNFPEGLATFVAALADAKLGLALAVAVAVHNIPEGVCVAMPVYYATGSKWKGFWWSFVSGVSEPIGGLVGYLVLYGNAMSDVAYGALFGVVGGMMVYISVKELLPTAHKYDPKDEYVSNCLFGGMAIMALSLILFQI